MIDGLRKKLVEEGYGHILYALLVETVMLMLIAFAGLFTLEMILPGIISGRFVLGGLFIIASLFIFFAAFLGRQLDISFSAMHARMLRALLIIGILWTFSILTLSLLSFPIWSIPIFLLSFGAIVYLTFKEFKK